QEVAERRRAYFGRQMEREPGRAGQTGVGPDADGGQAVGAVQKGHAEDDVDDVLLPGEEVAEEDRPLGTDLDPGLLADLASDALVERLAVVEPPAGQEPEVVGAVPDEEDLAVVDEEAGDADAKRHLARVSARLWSVNRSEFLEHVDRVDVQDDLQPGIVR